MSTLLVAAWLAWSLPPVSPPEPGSCAFRTEDRADGTLHARAACHWDLTPEQVAGVVERYDRHDEVFSVVVSAHAVGQDAQGRALYHQVHGAPMISAREVVLAVRTEPLADGVRVTWEKAATQPPLPEGRVEPRVNQGTWEIRSDGKGGTKLDYEIELHPDGAIPSFVVSWLQGVALSVFFEELEAAARAAADPGPR